jgi:hypothetical protein
MSSVGLILASFLAGILMLLIVAGLAALIWLHIRSQRQMEELAKNLVGFSQELMDTLELHRTDTTSMIDGARSSFTGIRQEIKTSQDAQAKALAAALKAHETAFKDTIGRINGDVLVKASVEAIRATRELSVLAQTLKNLLADHAAPAATDLGPEEYGPSDTIYAMRNDAGRLDDSAMQDEADEQAPLFSGGMTE